MNFMRKSILLMMNDLNNECDLMGASSMALGKVVELNVLYL